MSQGRPVPALRWRCASPFPMNRAKTRASRCRSIADDIMETIRRPSRGQGDIPGLSSRRGMAQGPAQVILPLHPSTVHSPATFRSATGLSGAVTIHETHGLIGSQRPIFSRSRRTGIYAWHCGPIPLLEAIIPRPALPAHIIGPPDRAVGNPHKHSAGQPQKTSSASASREKRRPAHHHNGAPYGQLQKSQLRAGPTQWREMMGFSRVARAPVVLIAVTGWGRSRLIA